MPAQAFVQADSFSAAVVEVERCGALLTGEPLYGCGTRSMSHTLGKGVLLDLEGICLLGLLVARPLEGVVMSTA